MASLWAHDAIPSASVGVSVEISPADVSLGEDEATTVAFCAAMALADASGLAPVPDGATLLARLEFAPDDSWRVLPPRRGLEAACYATSLSPDHQVIITSSAASPSFTFGCAVRGIPSISAEALAHATTIRDVPFAYAPPEIHVRRNPWAPTNTVALAALVAAATRLPLLVRHARDSRGPAGEIAAAMAAWSYPAAAHTSAFPAGELARDLTGARPSSAPFTCEVIGPSSSLRDVLGGGRMASPGALACAAGGVVLIEDVPACNPKVVEATARTAAEGFVRLVRTNGTCVFPTDAAVVGRADYDGLRPSVAGLFPLEVDLEAPEHPDVEEWVVRAFRGPSTSLCRCGTDTMAHLVRSAAANVAQAPLDRGDMPDLILVATALAAFRKTDERFVTPDELDFLAAEALLANDSPDNGQCDLVKVRDFDEPMEDPSAEILVVGERSHERPLIER